MVEVRRTLPAHQNTAILELLHKCFAYMEGRIDPPSSLGKLTEADVSQQANSGHVLMIEEGGVPVACLFVTPREKHFYLGKLAVHPSHQRKGMARRLIDEAEALAKAKGATFLELQTRIELIENHEAFSRMGFRKVGETSHAGYGRPTSITMQRAVEPNTSDARTYNE